MGVVAASARSSHYVTCSVLYKATSSSTNQMILFAGFGGFFISFVSSFLDSNHLILSSRIISICLMDWLGLLAVALLGVSAIFMLNFAIELSNPVLVSFVRVFDIVVSYGVQVIVLKDSPGILGIFGSTLVITSVSLLSFESSFIDKVPQKFRRII